jgi:hypothetical protein
LVFPSRGKALNRPPDWLETALAITGRFETAGDPFTAVAGDFDGQGLSCGVLQWNVGQGTLQKLAKAAGRDAVMAHMPVYGTAFLAAIESPRADALALVRSWQTRNVLHADVKRELARFCACPAMRAQQIVAARPIADAAWRDTEIWEAARGGVPGKQSFCWFFDLRTQNGGVAGISIAEIGRFLTQGGGPHAISGWLAARGPAQFGYRDCRRNALLWHEPVPDCDLELYALSYLRALKCAKASQGAAMNRKGTIAQTQGWVNGAMIDLTAALRGIAPASRLSPD